VTSGPKLANDVIALVSKIQERPVLTSVHGPERALWQPRNLGTEPHYTMGQLGEGIRKEIW